MPALPIPAPFQEHRRNAFTRRLQTVSLREEAVPIRPRRRQEAGREPTKELPPETWEQVSEEFLLSMDLMQEKIKLPTPLRH